MTDETLRELLGRVQERLKAPGTAAIDTQSRELLTTVMRDIEGALGGAPRGPASAHNVATLAVRFESAHPTLAELLRQIGALLGQAGI